MSYIGCADRHFENMKLWDAALAISENRTLGPCKTCGKPLHCVVEHVYSNDIESKTRRFKVVRAARLGTRMADGEGYDPFLFVLHNQEDNSEAIWPVFWAPGKDGGRRWGQFSPILSLREWRDLFEKLGAPSA